MAHIAKGSAETLAGLKGVFNSFENSAKIASDLTDGIARMAFLSARKLDHIIFKSNVYQCITREKCVFEFKDYKNCAFGKWYYSTGMSELGTLPAFREMEQYHIEFHNSAYIPYSIAAEGKDIIEHEAEIISAFERAEDVSHKLFDKIDETIVQYMERFKGIQF
jgi:methyl-accepting chemotaxis protein